MIVTGVGAAAMFAGSFVGGAISAYISNQEKNEKVKQLYVAINELKDRFYELKSHEFTSNFQLQDQKIRLTNLYEIIGELENIIEANKDIFSAYPKGLHGLPNEIDELRKELMDEVRLNEDKKLILVKEFEDQIQCCENERLILIKEFEGKIQCYENKKLILVKEFEERIQCCENEKLILVKEFEDQIQCYEDEKIILVKEFEDQIRYYESKRLILLKEFEGRTQYNNQTMQDFMLMFSHNIHVDHSIIAEIENTPNNHSLQSSLIGVSEALKLDNISNNSSIEIQEEQMENIEQSYSSEASNFLTEAEFLEDEVMYDSNSSSESDYSSEDD